MSPLPESAALYASSLGTSFVGEIRELLARGLAELGIAVELRDETGCFRDDVDIHVVLVPDEFFGFGAGTRLTRGPFPRRLILLNTEAPGSPWFAAASRFFPIAQSVWDIDHGSALQIADSGQVADFLALGYAEGALLGRDVDSLPDSYWARSLPRSTREPSFLNAAHDERPLDVFFAGRLTGRREEFFSAHASLLARYRGYFYFGPSPLAGCGGPEASMRGEMVRGLVQRSRVLLNVHEGERLYFEWHRIVLQGIWNRTLVISEPCGFNPVFEPGRHYVEARPPDIIETLEFFLRDPRGRQEAQAIVEAAFETLVMRCRLADSLRGCLARMGNASR